MNVLLTGAAGFIGRHLIMRFMYDKKLNNVTIIGIDKAAIPKDFDKLKNLIYYAVDILNESEIRQIIERHKPYIVFHLASMLADECEKSPDSCLAVNVIGTNNILKACVANDVKRVIFASSISVYDPHTPEPVSEEEAGVPVTIYGITKYDSELLGSWYTKKFDLEFIGLRLSVVFGPGRKSGITTQYSSKLIEDAFHYNSVEVIIDPDIRVNYLFISDAVEAMIKAAQIPMPSSKFYNIGGFEHPVRDLITTLRKNMPNLEVKFSLIYKSQHWPASFNVTKAERELGWKPTIDIEEAVNLYIQCLRNKDPYWYLRNTVKKERGAHEGG